MNRVCSVFRLVTLLAVTLATGSLWAKDEASHEAMLKIAHRDIVMLRAEVQGALP